jgi:rare lipoprotein A
MKRNITLFLFALVLTSLGAMENGEGIFRQEGIASWYGAEFDGRPTASGEIFDASRLTAAHPVLPFGTVLKITNKNNNKSVTVRVNDRGPFVAARIIDVSQGAARQLDMISTGTAPVMVESVDAVKLNEASGGVIQIQSASVEPFRSPEEASPAPAAVKSETGKRYRIQVGAYRTPRNAVDAFQRLRDAGLNPSYEKHEEYDRVVLPGVKSGELEAVTGKLTSAGFGETLLREER